jgi:hypothetical protein
LLDPHSDPAYNLLNWLAGQLGLGIWAVNLVCAAIFTAGLVKLCRAQPNPPLAILVAVPYLVIVVAMGYTRQAAALGLIMYAITFLDRGSYLRIGLTLLVAATFHKTAVVIIPFFVVAAARGSLLSVLVTVPAAFIGYELLLASSVNQLVANYVQAGYNSSGALARVSMNVVPALLLLSFRNRFRFSPQQRLFWILLSGASLVALAALFLVPSSTAVDRVALYLIPLQVAVLSRCPSAFGKREGQSLLLVVLVVLYSLTVELVWLNLGQFASYWIPYRNYLWAAEDQPSARGFETRHSFRRR